jgi:hypothetical protein
MSITTILCWKRLWIAGLIAAFSIAALAQTKPRATSFMQAMKESMERMDNGMKSAPMNGDVDHDFCTMMIPHHQGAIDLAKAELLYGKDPSMRRPVDVKTHFHFLFFLSVSLFPFSQAAPVAILPFALFGERSSLGARWVFSLQ